MGEWIWSYTAGIVLSRLAPAMRRQPNGRIALTASGREATS
jgi:hypothetical protein